MGDAVMGESEAGMGIRSALSSAREGMVREGMDEVLELVPGAAGGH